MTVAAWAVATDGQAGDRSQRAVVQDVSLSGAEPVTLRRLAEDEAPILVIGGRRSLAARQPQPPRPLTVTFTLVPTGDRSTLVELLAHDRTLRRGDAVMTPLGVRVFEGRASARHDGRDFVPLGAARSVTAVQRRTLDAIDRLPRPAPSLSVADLWGNFGANLAIASAPGRASEYHGGCIKGGARVSCF